MGRVTRLAVAAASAAAAALLLAVPAAQAAPAAKTGTKITSEVTPFGRALIVGSGAFKGFSLYFISSDNAPKSYGCTTGVTKTPVGPIVCTGPSNDHQAEWPAITTTGKPVAGPGVNAKLLGSVTRKGVGRQITYAGHPLYLFDEMPGAVTGEGWFEPGLPPWHGIWWLMTPGGHPLPWAGTLTHTVIRGKTVLAEQYLTGAGWVNFPVYSFTADRPHHAVCSGIAACARFWPPVLTSGHPALAGLSSHRAGRLFLHGGLRQVTWRGHPLYLFSDEQLRLNARGQPVAAGNGNNITAFGGTFRLVRVHASGPASARPLVSVPGPARW
jgi:predicted lipoprotein with Yx(FWY)xxD motif